MTYTPAHVRLLGILRHHRGMTQAIALKDLARSMGYGAGKSGTRRVQVLKRELIDAGEPIGSSTAGIGGGYYWMETADEIQSTLHQYCGRFYALSVSIKKLRGLLVQPESPQQTLSWGD